MIDLKSVKILPAGILYSLLDCIWFLCLRNPSNIKKPIWSVRYCTILPRAWFQFIKSCTNILVPSFCWFYPLFREKMTNFCLINCCLTSLKRLVKRPTFPYCYVSNLVMTTFTTL